MSEDSGTVQTKVLSVQEPQMKAKEEEKLLEIELPSGNDLAVLQAVGGTIGPYEESGKVSFQGIKRKLGLHQETLSRSLRRLEKEGLIEKINQDYSISERGESIISGTRTIHLPAILGEVYAIPIMRTIIPPDAS